MSSPPSSSSSFEIPYADAHVVVRGLPEALSRTLQRKRHDASGYPDNLVQTMGIRSKPLLDAIGAAIQRSAASTVAVDQSARPLMCAVAALCGKKGTHVEHLIDGAGGEEEGGAVFLFCINHAAASRIVRGAAHAVDALYTRASFVRGAKRRPCEEAVRLVADMARMGYRLRVYREQEEAAVGGFREEPCVTGFLSRAMRAGADEVVELLLTRS